MADVKCYLFLFFLACGIGSIVVFDFASMRKLRALTPGGADDMAERDLKSLAQKESLRQHIVFQ